MRSNVHGWTHEELWQAYMQLTEAELAFRIHNSDLRIRPVWHRKEDRVLAHNLVSFLAYVLWKTLARMCRHAGRKRGVGELADSHEFSRFEVGRLELRKR